MKTSTRTLHLCLGCRMGTFHFFKPGRRCIIEVCRVCGDEEKFPCPGMNVIEIRRLTRTWNEYYAPQFMKKVS